MRVNYAAVAVAALLQFALGALWYSPLLFSNRWLQLIGKNAEEMKRAANPVIYLAALACSVVMAYVLALVCVSRAAKSASQGAMNGALLGIGLVATAMLTGYLFEQRPAELYLINAGYFVVSLILMGTLLGAWRKPA